MPLLRKMGHADDVLPALKTQFGQWVGRGGPLFIPLIVPQATDYWHEMAIHVPFLSKVALALLAVTPPEACVERCFSHQALVHSDLRGRLDDDSIRSLMAVRMNLLRVFDFPCMPRQKKQRTG